MKTAIPIHAVSGCRLKLGVFLEKTRVLLTRTDYEPALVYSIMGAVGLSVLLLICNSLVSYSLSPQQNSGITKYHWFAALMNMSALQSAALYIRRLRLQMIALFVGVFTWSCVGRLLWQIHCAENVLSYFGSICCFIFGSGCGWGYLRLCVFPREPRLEIYLRLTKLLHKSVAH